MPQVPVAPGYGQSSAYAAQAQSGTPTWQAHAASSGILSPQGKSRVLHGGGLSPAQAYPDTAGALPWGPPADAIGFQPWQVVEAQIAACITATMAMLGQPEWMVCCPCSPCLGSTWHASICRGIRFGLTCAACRGQTKILDCELCSAFLMSPWRCARAGLRRSTDCAGR